MIGKSGYQQGQYWAPPPQGKGPSYTAPGWNQQGYNPQPQNTGHPHWVSNNAEKGGGHWEKWNNI
eukprot:3950335-Heterocapsa_arctica.AAC.1